MATTASAVCKGHGSLVTSRSMALLTLARCSSRTRRAMDSRSSASGSDGCQVRSESALAKCKTCCPVPLAISNTRPRRGRTRASTSSIGPLLRSAAGVDHFPLAVFSPRCLSIRADSLFAEQALGGGVDRHLDEGAVDGCPVLAGGARFLERGDEAARLEEVFFRWSENRVDRARVRRIDQALHAVAEALRISGVGCCALHVA